MMVNPNTYRFVTDYSVEIAISFDLDDLLEHGETYMFNITNVNKQRSPRDMKVRDTVIAIIDNFFETNIGGKTKCVKMNETLNQWKAL